MAGVYTMPTRLIWPAGPPLRRGLLISTFWLSEPRLFCNRKGAKTMRLATPRVIEVWIPTNQVPDVFDRAKPLYLYDTRTGHGQWCSSTDGRFRQWQRSKGTTILKLFEVGFLPRKALAAASARGINLPYWRDRLRALPGWIICRATIIQKKNR